MTKMFYMTKGLPGSGKSTWADDFIKGEDPGKVARVNKDSLREMLHLSRFGGKKTEKWIVAARDVMLEVFMEGGVRYVISDDTNFGKEHEATFRALCEKYGYHFTKVDFTNIPVEECIKRDLMRNRSVGEQVIRTMYKRHVKPVEQYRPNPPAHIPGAPSAVMVDIDGTVALSLHRNPYDPSLYHTDEPYQAVIKLVEQLWEMGERIIFCSGRDAAYYEETYKWIMGHMAIEIEALVMRKAGDRRNDAIIKEELYREHIEGKYNVRFVLDDRNRVVNKWREIGLPTFQVAPGDF